MRSDQPGSAVQTRQNKIIGEYTDNSKKLDRQLHGTQLHHSGPIERRFHEFSNGHVAGFVVGPFVALLRCHLNCLLDHIAESMADQHCQFYNLPQRMKPKLSNSSRSTESSVSPTTKPCNANSKPGFN